MVKVGAVSYLNTKPLIFGFEQGMMADSVELRIDHPANIAALLIDGKVDIGLIPVAVIPLLQSPEIVSDFCIGSDGEVVSVCLFSDVPMNEIENILLDYQSRTSVELLKILLQEHWQITPGLLHAEVGYEKKITGTTAGLVIGDRAFTQRLRSKYVFDLGLAWKAMTGLPFVFAAWVSNKKLPEAFISAFNKANATGLNKLDAVIAGQVEPGYDLHRYYTENISYRLDGHKREGMNLFLRKINISKKMAAPVL